MIQYRDRLIEDTGKTLVTGLEDDFAPLWVAIQDFGSRDEFTQKALDGYLEDRAQRSLRNIGFFGLTSELKNPRCYFRKEEGHFEFGFDSYQLATWKGTTVGPSVSVSLFVDPLKDGAFLSDLTVQEIPSGYIGDLFNIYRALHEGGFRTEPTVRKYVSGTTSPMTRIIPVTKGVDALRMLKRAGEMYADAKEMDLINFPGSSDESPHKNRILQAKREIYGLDLLRILGVDLTDSGE